MLVIGLDGKMVPPGRSELLDVANFATLTALPAWLTTRSTAGTAYEGSSSTFNTLEGIYTGTTATGNALRAASLETIPFDMTKAEAMMITFRDVRFGGGGAPTAYSVGLTDDLINQTKGIRYIIDSGVAFAKRRYGTGSATSSAVTAFTWTPTQRRDISVLAFTRSKYVYLYENDQIMHAVKLASMSLGAVSGHLMASRDTADNTNTFLKCAAVERRIWIGGGLGTPGS